MVQLEKLSSLFSEGARQRKPLPESVTTINSEGVGLPMLEPR
jgi:hypothetical protein